MLTKPRIALVHEYLTNFAGSEQVLLALHELYPEAPIYAAMYYPDRCPQFAGADVRTSFLQHWPRLKEKVYVPVLPLAVEGYDLSSYDVVISDSHIAAKGVITKPSTIHICYCHTPTRYAWSAEVDPRASSSALRRLAAHYLRLWDIAAAQRVDHWIANSHYVAGRIAKYYRAKARVIYPPVNTSQYHRARYQMSDEYYLYFGRLIDYKKPEIVVEAFNKLNKRLVVIGRGPMLAQLQRQARPNIEFITEYLSVERLGRWLSGAAALIFTAEEDFGITIVETLAAGRPVIAYQAGGASEIIKQGQTGILIQDQTAEAIVEAVVNFKPEAYDRDRLQATAKRFDQSLFKAKITALVNQLAEKGNHGAS